MPGGSGPSRRDEIGTEIRPERLFCGASLLCATIESPAFLSGFILHSEHSVPTEDPRKYSDYAYSADRAAL